ncbi:hypothetical protein O181_064457 [Austropuccinia psidii MF-1]|uniref:Uncharacterized protein n=1 Tax=Austropuccinia psidii MF-1 TaxID=1389203 RepID=A0A9Q3I2C1_9BASI|nr:hypothetical protein [Austropuccinia psidii MF-1]
MGTGHVGDQLGHGTPEAPANLGSGVNFGPGGLQWPPQRTAHRPQTVGPQIGPRNALKPKEPKITIESAKTQNQWWGQLGPSPFLRHFQGQWGQDPPF